jgi:hypothetical protein
MRRGGFICSACPFLSLKATLNRQYYEATKDMVPEGASSDNIAEAKQRHMNHISRHRAVVSTYKREK